jgi:adenine phosphoribosyltransferase
LEYGTDALEMHVDAVDATDRVLVVDDVIATGGTAAAAARLLNRPGAHIVGMIVMVELTFLNGRAALNGLPMRALVTYGD